MTETARPPIQKPTITFQKHQHVHREMSMLSLVDPPGQPSANATTTTTTPSFWVSFDILRSRLVHPHVYYIASVAIVLVWSCICAWLASVSPGWSAMFEEADIRPLATLFLFGLVFRFNQCYNRWWLGREAWGSILQGSLELARMVNVWIVDEEISAKMTRLIVCFSYACKSQLRGVSLASAGEGNAGQELVQSGLLAEAERKHMLVNPSWEPELILDMLRVLLSQAMLKEYSTGGVLYIPKSNKIHEKLFSPMDRAILELGRASGQNITIRSAGMPPSYDAIHHGFFWIFFLVAPAVWGATVGWVGVIISLVLSTMTLILTDLGSSLIDPFGHDTADLPVDTYCKTLQAQVAEIRRRHQSGDMLVLTKDVRAGAAVWESAALAADFFNGEESMLDLEF